MLEFVKFVVTVVLAGIVGIFIVDMINKSERIPDKYFRMNDIQNSFEEKVDLHL